jgi:hypothetical protein
VDFAESETPRWLAPSRAYFDPFFLGSTFAEGALEHSPNSGRRAPRALRRLQRESPTSPFVFVTERRSPFTTASFAR